LVLFEIDTAVLLKVQILWDITPSRLSNTLAFFASYLFCRKSAR